MKTMLALFLAFTVSLVGALPLAAYELARGTVYADTNANGQRDDGETGLAGVLVANGRAVIATDDEGRWALPVDDDDILFVIKPRDYHPPVDADQKPQYHYIHKPAGSPDDLDFPGVAPTGPLPPSIDFPLIPQEEPDAFTGLFFGDPQPYSEQEVAWFDADIIDEVLTLEEEYLFVTTLGDIVGDDLDLFTPLTASVARLGVPAWYVYGNHDMNFDVAHDHLADETFERVFGPANYAAFYGPVCFVTLDNVLYPRPDGKGGYIGGFTNEQLTFVENLLAHVDPETLIVLQTHIPLEIYRHGGDSSTWREEDRDRLFALFQHHPNVLALSAHTHTQNHHFYGPADGWPHEEEEYALHHYNVGTTSGSWWQGKLDARGIPITPMRDGTPNGYAFIRFDGNSYTLDYRAANHPADERMYVHTPNFIREGEWRRHIMVNVYNGTPRDTVEIRLVGSDDDWRKLRRQERFDPRYAYIFAARDLATEPPTNRQLPYPQDATHIWAGNLPGGMEPGDYTVEVRHTDFRGHVTTTTKDFTVME